MMKINVRAAHSGDIGFIAALEKEAFSMPQSENELSKMIASPDNTLLVATHGDELLGYIGAYTVCRESDIVTVAVSPKYRRCGVARALIEALCDELSGLSDAIFLEVRESNEGARALYLSLGFAETGVRRGYYKKPTEDAVLYKKEI